MLDQLNAKKFEQWAIVELFGHQRIAGRVSEQTIGGCAFVRVDVPALEAIGTHAPTQPLTKLFGNGAIYGISFVDEPTAKYTARQLRVQPISEFELRRALQDLPVNESRQLPFATAQDAADDDDDDSIPY